ncbi:hypothetical protein D3C78_1521190 [compost metagenome]
MVNLSPIVNSVVNDASVYHLNTGLTTEELAVSVVVSPLQIDGSELNISATVPFLFTVTVTGLAAEPELSQTPAAETVT